MVKSKFQKGDKVRRFIGGFNGMLPGAIDTVVDIPDKGYDMTLEKYGWGHSMSNFVLVERGVKNWRKHLQ